MGRESRGHESRESENRTFRLVCGEAEIPAVERLLRVQGYEFRPLPFDPFARELLAEPFPLGTSFALRFGRIYIQDRSSMLPPLALAPPSGAGVLDMCSAPGSKTGMLSRMVGPDGFVLASEPSAERVGILRMNLRRYNAANVGTVRSPAQDLSLSAGRWTHIQLDPPCSGWGTLNRNPGARELWSGDKLPPLIALQKTLLTKAASLLAPGGVVVYSTCTTNVQENEEQVRWAMDNLGLVPESLERPQGFTFETPLLPGMDGVLRVADDSLGQGFFLARLRRPGALPHDVLTGAGAHDCARPGAKNALGSLPGAPLDRERLPAMQGAGPMAVESLPPGMLYESRGTLFFLHQGLLPCVEQGLRVRGFPLGRCKTLESRGGGRPGSKKMGGKKAGKGRKNGGAGGMNDRARFQVDPTARALMPSVQEAGPAAVQVDDAASLEALLQGRSLTAASADAKGPAPLYFDDMPLGWLTRKGKRLLWPEKSMIS
ncbi:RsmB/NOP family class I SAM-dependent RNA methyltransferase [Pseudodesulfovibrio senegalensis]|uniref:RsmB/NOP family class I SAM-dependent RNA methyltransferase n=1 Tax=Pseudodesulfovibrio senegalensis TaxID=1721087 RepID=A0A6N6N0S5_9BACT|nr:RsmB/NOP family class I SAM-dependent RNA methyltransferase [Pseudodesulfovibrio senegalensis]KAB1441333.1 RsmB/NOP family class I SAM-dependent RNA methyltransferase [Pseudodesulfovibrio senegalensis]